MRAEALRDVGCAPVDPVVMPALEALGFVAAAVWIGVERARSLFLIGEFILGGEDSFGRGGRRIRPVRL